MRMLALLLLIVNVAIFLFAGGRDASVERATVSAKADVNTEGMMLLHEVRGDEDVANVEPTIDVSTDVNIDVNVDLNTTANDSANNNDQVSSDADTVVAEEVDLLCYRIGPFKQKPDWDAAKEWMAAQKIRYQSVRSASRDKRAIRVYLGPYASRTETKPLVAQLEKDGIDHFIDAKNDPNVRISLGYFTQEELATKFIETLHVRGIEAKSETEYRAMGPFDWIEVSVNTTQSDLLSQHWRKKGIALLAVDCREISITPAINH